MRNGPLDMRFNTKKGQPLSDWINTAPFEEILNVLYEYGDEKHAKLISNAIIDRSPATLKYTAIFRICVIKRVIDIPIAQNKFR